MRRITILLLLAFLWSGHASRRLQPRTRGGGDTIVDNVKYDFESSDIHDESTTPSETLADTDTSEARGSTQQQRQWTKPEVYQSRENVLERGEPTLAIPNAAQVTNGGGAMIRMAGNETLEDNAAPIKREKIVDGTATAFGDFDFVVHGANPNDNTKICGGVLIHPDIFLTAANCRTLFFEGSDVFIGSTNLLSTLGFAESRVISEKMPHPDYDSVSGENDLMIVKLDSFSSKMPADFNKVSNFPTVGESLTIVGFGWTSIDEQVLSPSLQQASITVVDFAQCEANNNLAVSVETQICAGQTAGGPDSCDFDTGGPLLTADGGFLYGINSFAVGCGFPDSEGIFTRVSAFQSFIESGICDLSADPPESCLEEPAPTTGPTNLGNAPAPIPNSTPTPSPQPGQSISPLSTPTISFSPTLQSAPITFGTKGPTRGDDEDNGLWNGMGKGNGKGKGRRRKRKGTGHPKGKKRSGKKSSKKSPWVDRSRPGIRYRSGIFSSVKGTNRQQGGEERRGPNSNIFRMGRP